MNLATSLEKIKGVGAKTAKQLHDAGLYSVGDLLNFLPRRHDDYSRITQISALKPGKVTVRSKVENVSTRRLRGAMRLTTATLTDDSGKVQAVWFNQSYREAQLKTNEEFFFSGDFELSYGRYQLMNPSAEKISDMPVNSAKILPIYPAIKGLKSHVVRKILMELKPLMTMLPETLPPNLVQSEGLVSRSDALIGMHFSAMSDDVEKARERLAFEEVFGLILASQLNKQENTKLEAWQIPFDRVVVKRFVESLPFKLTGDQRRAAWDVFQSFEGDHPMNRLLQGDVGAGKTVVAALAARLAAAKGFQTALMAPTEILASQHAETLARLLEPHGVVVGLLTGSIKGKARQTLYDQIAAGSVDVIVGTHALIQETVSFHHLGFVVIDEQHRFGVAQRQALLRKSTKLPHLLSMTATPIPRSLALTLYGEMDVSVIGEKPADRKPIKTKIWPHVKRAELYEIVDKQIKAGRQVYVICPLIENNLSSDAKSVQVECDRLRKSIFKHRRIGLLHGKLKSDEKTVVMQQFFQGQLDILVSTTVVEVGVDVPNATVMMIENAEQFGLSQLHQLRGRVGRSAHQSYCFLMLENTAKASSRLKEIEKSNDGFYLAEVDLRLRGPGEIYGRAQHGPLNLKVASLADTRLMARAKRAAERFIASDMPLERFTELANTVHYYQRLTSLN